MVGHGKVRDKRRRPTVFIASTTKQCTMGIRHSNHMTTHDTPWPTSILRGWRAGEPSRPPQHAQQGPRLGVLIVDASASPRPPHIARLSSSTSTLAAQALACEAIWCSRITHIFLWPIHPIPHTTSTVYIIPLRQDYLCYGVAAASPAAVAIRACHWGLS